MVRTLNTKLIVGSVPRKRKCKLKDTLKYSKGSYRGPCNRTKMWKTPAWQQKITDYMPTKTAMQTTNQTPPKPPEKDPEHEQQLSNEVGDQ